MLVETPNLDLAPFSAALQALQSALAVVPQPVLVQQQFAEQARHLVEDIAFNAVTAADKEAAPWMGSRGLQGLSLFGESGAITASFASDDRVLWINVSDGDGLSWQFEYEALFEGGIGAGLAAGLNALSGGGEAPSDQTGDGGDRLPTVLRINIADNAEVISTHTVTADGSVIDERDWDAHFERAVDRVNQRFAGASPDEDDAAEDAGGPGFPGGVIGRRVLRGAVAGLAGAAAAKASRKARDQKPERVKEGPTEAPSAAERGRHERPRRDEASPAQASLDEVARLMTAEDEDQADDAVAPARPQSHDSEVAQHQASVVSEQDEERPDNERRVGGGRRIPVEDVSDPGRWFFMRRGKQCGPVTGTELKKLFDEGELEDRARVWSEELPKWVRARDVPGLLAEDGNQSAMVAELSPPPVLEAVDESLEIERFELGDETTIGRSRRSDLTLSDQAVSGNHAVIRKSGEQYVVTDLQSTNGVFVNGSRILMPTELRHGDTVRFGTTKYRFVHEAASDVVDKTVMMPVDEEMLGPAPTDRLPDSVRCPECHSELVAGAAFCAVCGHGSGASATPASTEPAPLVQTCRRCGNDFDIANRFCTRCGESALPEGGTQRRFCGHCGFEVKADDRFCGQCGTKLT